MSNSAKRKKRSSSLKGSLNPSKRHRDRFNIELDNLAKLLPFSHDVIQKLDKLSILRLSASYLRAKNFFKEQHWSDPEADRPKAVKAAPEIPLALEGNGSFSKYILEALDGFVIVLTQDFELFYASETIQQYLGLSQASVIHQDFLRFIHVDDHDMIKNYLQPCPGDHQDEPPKIKILDDENDGSSEEKKKDDETLSESSESKDISTERNFVCRMKCILNTSAGFFKPFRCSGRLREMTVPDSDKQEYGLFLVCTPMETMNNSILEIRLKTSLFCTKNRMDLSFMDIDQKGRSLLGYHKRDIALQSSYCMIHFDDIPILKQLHTDLMGSAKCQGTFRMLNKNMKWQWLTGTAQVVFKGNEADFIITTNRPLSEEEGEEVLRQRGQFPALPFTPPIDNNKRHSFFMENPETDFKMPGGPPPKFGPATNNYGKRKRPDNYPEGSPHIRGPTSAKDGSLSPQPNGSPFHEDSFNSTACTSAPFSLNDLELGVDLQDELSRDAPELMLLSQDFPSDFGNFPDYGRDTSLANHMGSLAMEEVTNLDDLPTLEDAMALVNECLSTPTESTASLSSPCGSQASSYPQSPPHVQCDPFSPTSSVGQPSPFASPIGSQMGPPSVSPSGLPTPDPSPLGRREGDPARINISWQGPGHLKMANQQVPQVPRGQHSPQQMNPPHVNGGVLSKSALLATMKKQEQRPYPSCGTPVPQPQSMPMAWSPQPQPANNVGMQQSYNNWNNAYSNNYRQGGRGLQGSRDPTWGQGNQGVSVPPLFEDTLRNLDYPEAASMISPPYQDESMAGYRFHTGQTPVTSASYSKMEGW